MEAENHRTPGHYLGLFPGPRGIWGGMMPMVRPTSITLFNNYKYSKEDKIHSLLLSIWSRRTSKEEKIFLRLWWGSFNQGQQILLQWWPEAYELPSLPAICCLSWSTLVLTRSSFWTDSGSDAPWHQLATHPSNHVPAAHHSLFSEHWHIVPTLRTFICWLFPCS